MKLKDFILPIWGAVVALTWAFLFDFERGTGARTILAIVSVCSSVGLLGYWVVKIVEMCDKGQIKWE